MIKGGMRVSGKSKEVQKRRLLSPGGKKNRKEPKNAVPQTPAAEEEDPRGKFLFCMGKKVRLIKSGHNKLSPSFGFRSSVPCSPRSGVQG